MARYMLSVHDGLDSPPPTPERTAEFGWRMGALDADLRAADPGCSAWGWLPRARHPW